MSLESKLQQDLSTDSLKLTAKFKELEDKNGAIPINLERALLIISGVDTEKELQKYLAKIARIHDDFTLYFRMEMDELKRKGYYLENTHDQIARYLHRFLWEKKPRRYNENASPLLKSVIDAQDSWFRRRKPVGNALGLASLYIVLGLRSGLDLLLAPPKSNEYIVRLRRNFRQELYDIDVTKPNGFDPEPQGGGKHWKNVVYNEKSEENFRNLLSKVYSAREKMKEERPETLYHIDRGPFFLWKYLFQKLRGQ